MARRRVNNAAKTFIQLVITVGSVHPPKAASLHPTAIYDAPLRGSVFTQLK